MAEFSGFFDAMLDELSGKYDREYIAENFANYFKLFVGNGVFISPTNQLKINSSDGLTVVMEEGWAFINGYWYHNDERRVVVIPENSSPQSRVDSLILRWNRVTREITLITSVGSTDIFRNSNVWDLKLAEVIIEPFAESIKQSNITDKRTDERVCGFVKGLLEVISTDDLFNQYKAIFDEWFDTVKNQLTGDLALRLQTEFIELNQNVQDYYDSTTENIREYKEQTTSQVNEYQTQTQTKIEQYNANYQQTLESCEAMVQDLSERDFLISERDFNFENNVCIIQNSKITDTTILDLYFTKDCINEAMRCVPYIESENGGIKITVSREPRTQLRGTIGVRVR